MHDRLLFQMQMLFGNFTFSIFLDLFITEKMSCKDSPIDKHITTITEMGFTDIESIKKSLQLANNDLNNAVAILSGEIDAGMSIHLYYFMCIFLI